MPGAPGEVTAISEGSGGLVIRWQAPAAPHAEPTDYRVNWAKVVPCTRSTQPAVCGLPAWVKRWRAPSAATVSPNWRERNSYPLSVITVSSSQPRAERSEATRRASCEVHFADGLRGVTCSSAQAEAMSIAVYCQTLPFEPVRRPRWKQLG